jgi:hypothetical protein
MGTNTKRDFASLLDDLFQAPAPEHGLEKRPTIPFDYLSVADELHSGRIKVAGEAAAAEYRDMATAPETAFDALLAAADLSPADELPAIEPDAIARELGLEKLKVARDFGRVRRDFAFRNHPDRVAPHLRERAIQRMQVANMLIDEAKRRALVAARS